MSYDPAVREIHLLNGRGTAIVDADDYDRLATMRWFITHGYALAKVRTEARWVTIRMHRFILGAPAQLDVDHKNGDKLDNRRANLRLCTRKGNSQNSPKRRVGTYTSIYKGVCLLKRARTKKWLASIRVDGRLIGLRQYASEIEAARAYDAAAAVHFGEFARLNFPAEAPSA